MSPSLPPSLPPVPAVKSPSDQGLSQRAVSPLGNSSPTKQPAVVGSDPADTRYKFSGNLGE